jgi:transglutaminase-like putative cysteine protease
MAGVVNRSYIDGSQANLATDLARYGSAASWRGVYYRGEKIGFTVSQTVKTREGYEINEDGRLQMTLLGATTAATIHTTARLAPDFALRSFDFLLDPGTGPIRVRGEVEGLRVKVAVTSSAGSRSEVHDLREPPVLALNLSRLLANGRLVPGSTHRWSVFDPATLQNAPLVATVGKREVVRSGERRVPAFRVEMEMAGLKTTSWVSDTGEVVREESPLGLMTIRESPERARGLSVPERVQADLLEAAAVVPVMTARIDDPRHVRLLRLRLAGADLAGLELNGVGQKASGDTVEIRDAQTLPPGPPDPDAGRYLAPEPLIESDAPEIVAEAERAVRGAIGDAARAEKLVRHVNGLLDKKPTISLPSAREVLRTRVGDCNEHTALYVAMARAVGIPSRIAVGLAWVRGAFYYHAWAEVYLSETPGQGRWVPVDPTFNQYPADATHLRLARGGLDKQMVVLPLIGRLKMTVVDLELAPDSVPILVGAESP